MNKTTEMLSFLFQTSCAIIASVGAISYHIKWSIYRDPITTITEILSLMWLLYCLCFWLPQLLR